MALPPTLAADSYSSGLAALAQLLKQGQRVDPFADQRKFASDLMTRAAQPVGSEGEGWARLGQSAVGGLTQLGNAYFKRQWDQGARAEMADIMGEKDETKRIEKLKAAQYIDPEIMAPIFGNILAGRTERDQRSGIGTSTYNIFGGGQPAAPVVPPPTDGTVPPPAPAVPPAADGSVSPPVPTAPPPPPPPAPAPTQTSATPPPQGSADEPTPAMLTTASLESSGRPTAVNPTSGAAGLYQIMPDTAADLRARYPELNLPNNNAASWSVPQQNAAKVRYDQDSARILAQNGMPVTQASLYLAHRAGAQGAVSLMRQNPDTPMSAVVPAAWIAQNPDMQGKTTGQFFSMAQQRFPDVADMPGGPSPGEASPGGPRNPNLGQLRQEANSGQPPVIIPTIAQGDAGDDGVQLAQAQQPPKPPGKPTATGYDPGADWYSAAERAKAAGRPELAAELAQKGFEAREAYRLHVEKEKASQGQAEAVEARKRAAAQAEWDRQHGITSKDKEAEDKAKIEAANRQRVDAFSVDFRKDPDVVKYQVSRPVFKSAIEAANTNSLAGDLNLVYAFATMMDPGSVVREGEQGMVRATASAGTQVRGLLERLQGNSSLDADTKSKLLDQMHSRYTSYRDEYDRVGKYWEGRAKRAGVDPEDIYMRSDPVPYTRGQPVIYGGATSGSPLPPNAAPPPVTTQELTAPPPGSGPPKPPMVYRDGKLVPQ